MLIWTKTYRAFLLVCIVATFGIARTEAQTMSNPVHDLALKSGESTELGDLYWVNSSCKSLLNHFPKMLRLSVVLTSQAQAVRTKCSRTPTHLNSILMQ